MKLVSWLTAIFIGCRFSREDIPNELTGYFPNSNNLSQSLSDKFQFVDIA